MILMRNIVICCDGTWNTPEQETDGVPTPTNVVRLFNAVAEKDAKGHQQVKYYHPGIGSEGGLWDKVGGGGFGVGLGKNIMSAYKWLGANYRPMDRIYLFGFSRGAYTVRSLAGMMFICGLLDLRNLPDDEVWKRVDAAHKKGYRERAPKSKWAKGMKFHTGVKVHFLGVWDTVGALGIPNDLAILNLLDRVDKYQFNDTTINKGILNARHAVAIDERRATFAPTLWTGKGAERPTVKQIWFPGVHCDVGGGYPQTGLSDGALRWMMDEASALGLGIDRKMAKQVQPSSSDVLHDSLKGVFKMLRSEPRSAPLFSKSNKSAFHPSALERFADPPITQGPYWPTRSLKPGESTTVPVYAAEPWNYTGVYLEQGVAYEFEANGQWVDRSVKCGPGGTDDGKFQAGELFHLAGQLLGQAEKLFKKVRHDEQADFKGTRRYEQHPWFMLTGAIANAGSPRSDGGRVPMETIAIGDGCTYRPKRSGYLYCFANDAWHFYDNNKGSVELTVKRPKGGR